MYYSCELCKIVESRTGSSVRRVTNVAVVKNSIIQIYDKLQQNSLNLETL